MNQKNNICWPNEIVENLSKAEQRPNITYSILIYDLAALYNQISIRAELTGLSELTTANQHR